MIGLWGGNSSLVTKVTVDIVSPTLYSANIHPCLTGNPYFSCCIMHNFRAPLLTTKKGFFEHDLRVKFFSYGLVSLSI